MLLRKSGAPPPSPRENSNLFNYLKLNIIKLPKIDLGHPPRQIKLSPGNDLWIHACLAKDGV